MIAIKRGLWSKNPYDDFLLKRGKHKDPIFLTEEEIERIINYDPPKSVINRMEQVKDMFIFQCFTGLAFIDMINFSKEDVILDGDCKIIRSNKIKTDENYVLLLLPDAEKVAEKYNYNMPQMHNQNYNTYLKTLATAVGINKPLTSHCARHNKYPFTVKISNLQNNFHQQITI